ncbi:hypothetical protein EXS74_01970 [Candidatus Woesearchaeota archaeon]|nr:hypothetical protein [Candidatus Woesearchaeota archaeon]
MNTEEITWKEKKKFLKGLNTSEELLKEALNKSSKTEKKSLENIANIFFSPLSQRIPLIFPKASNKLQQAILQSGMNILSISYLSIILFTSTLVLFLGTTIGILSFYTVSIWHGFILGIFLSITTEMVFLFYPFCARRNRQKELEEEAPFIINHCSALSNAGLKTASIFQILNNIPYYPAFSIYCKRIENYENYLHLSLAESIKKTAETNPSPKIKKFLLEWAQVIDEKKDQKSFLKEKAKNSVNVYHQQKSFLRSYKNTWGEIHRFLKVFSLRTGQLIAIPVIIVGVVFLFQTSNTNNSYFFIILTSIFLIGWLPVLIDTLYTLKKYQKQETSFVSLIKDLVQERNILKLENNYTILNPEVNKLKNQYKMGIPIEKALETFARDTKNPLIQATISMSLEAKKSGADLYNTIYELGNSKILRKILQS